MIMAANNISLGSNQTMNSTITLKGVYQGGQNQQQIGQHLLVATSSSHADYQQ